MYFKNKTILITGGTGSFGQKMTEILLKYHEPRTVRIFSRDELKQWEMEKKFNASDRLRFFIGDIRDKDRLYRAMDGVDIVIHAAALKHVPLCEYNPFEAIKTNVVGGENVINAAIDCNVEKVLAISTDKAVNPVNLYGATKMCMEKLFVAANSYVGAKRNTIISCARYGNVVGSRGSVIPLMLEQKSSGSVTITDERMTRFWITLEQGVEFVNQCIENMHGGEIFVPKISSMRISDVAAAVAPGASLKYIGIRPGEKLHECLITEDEARHALEYDKFFVILPEHPWWNPEKWTDGKTLPDTFRYTSDKNDQWLKSEELIGMIGK